MPWAVWGHAGSWFSGQSPLSMGPSPPQHWLGPPVQQITSIKGGGRNTGGHQVGSK